MAGFDVSVRLRMMTRDLTSGARRVQRTMQRMSKSVRRSALGMSRSMRGAARGVDRPWVNAFTRIQRAAFRTQVAVRGVTRDMARDFQRHHRESRARLSQARSDLYSTAFTAAPMMLPAYQGVRYEDKLYEVAKLYGLDAETTRGKGLKALDLQKKVNIDKMQIGDVMASAGRLGVPLDKLQGFTYDTLLSAKSFEMGKEAGNVATIMARIKQQFSLTEEGAARTADAFNILGNFGEYEHRELLRAFQRGGGMMAKKGFTAGQSGVLFSMGLIGGYGAERSGRMTAGLLNTIYSKGSAKTKEGAKFRAQMKELGFSYKEFQGFLDKGQSFNAFRGFMNAIEEYKNRYKDPFVGMRKQQELMANMFPRGQQMILSFLTHWKLLERQIDLVLDKDGKIKSKTNVNGVEIDVFGSRKNEVANRQKSALEKLKKTYNTFDRIMTKSGFNILDTVKWVATGVNGYLASFEAYAETNGGTIKRIMQGITIAVGAVFAGIAGHLALAALRFSGLTFIIGKLWSLFVKPFAGGFLVGLLSGSGSLGRMIVLTYRYAGALGVLKFVAGKVFSLMGGVGRMIALTYRYAGALGLLKTVLRGVFRLMGGWIGVGITAAVMLYENWDWVKGKLFTIWDAIAAKYNEFKNLLNTGLTNFASKFMPKDQAQKKANMVMDPNTWLYGLSFGYFGKNPQKKHGLKDQDFFGGAAIKGAGQKAATDIEGAGDQTAAALNKAAAAIAAAAAQIGGAVKLPPSNGQLHELGAP